MKRKKILFIINPKSGNNKKLFNGERIKKFIKSEKFDYEVLFTKYQSHAKEIIRKLSASELDILVAIGGDGMINEVIQNLNKEIFLAIVPTGSGNGLARHLKISVKNKKHTFNLLLFAENNYHNIDLWKFDDKDKFINVAGIGFDAYISQLFTDVNKRGFFSYVRLVIKHFVKYKGINCKIDFTNEEGSKKLINIKKAFLVSFANTTQFGNNAYIAPTAKDNDGLINICILKKFSFIASFKIAYLMFTKKIEKSKYYTSYKAKKLFVSDVNTDIAQIDGELMKINGIFNIEKIDYQLKVIC